MGDEIPSDVAQILGPNERVELYIKQKIYHPKINIDSVVITNERIILRHPHALGLKKDFTDFNYMDFANVILDRGIMRSTLKCILRMGGEPLMLNDLPNSEAERAYGIIRENLGRFQAPLTMGGYGIAPGTGMYQQQQPPPSGYVPPYSQQPPPAGFYQQPAPGSGNVAEVVCRNCGQRFAAGTRFCGACGSQL
jgi:hypothetical protein